MKLSYHFGKLILLRIAGIFLIFSVHIHNKYCAVSSIAFWLHSKPDISIASSVCVLI